MSPLRIACLIPPHYDYLCATLVEGLNDLGHECRGLHESNYCRKLPRSRFSEYIAGSDVVIAFSGTLVDYRPLRYARRARVAFVDGTDVPDLAPIPMHSVHHIFKRELLPCLKAALGDSISPLPFGIEKRYLGTDASERTIDVSFVGSMSNFLRSSVNHFLRSFNNERIFSGGTGEIAYDGLSGESRPTPEYYRILSSSLASIDVPGRGWDCGRTWEIIGSGAALLKFRSDILSPDPLIEGEHYLGFSSIAELAQLVHDLPARRQDIELMAVRCQRFGLQYHTTTRRAEYFLNQLFAGDSKARSLKDLAVRTIAPRSVLIRSMIYRMLRWGYNRTRRFLPTAN